MSRIRCNTRQFERASVAVEVHYRTAGSFLVSYSLNLSKGGLFLETNDLLPVGTKLSVRFTIPGALESIDAKASVMWVRRGISTDGSPPGLGLAFRDLDDNIGKQIDELVRNFSGVKLLAIGGDASAVERLARSLRSVLNCAVKRALSAGDGLKVLSTQLDMVVLDLDSAGAKGLEVVEAAASCEPPVPLIALARHEQRANAAAAAGATVVLDNPPPHELLSQQVLELLGKPIS